MSPVPTQQKALLLQAKHGEFVVGTRPVPKPGPGEILVRNEASALNPVDWKIQTYGLFLETYPAVLGSEAAGVVEAVGEGVTEYKPGDRVVYEGYRTDDFNHTTFQQYTTINPHLAVKVPESLTFDQIVTIPAAFFTVAVGFYHVTNGPRFTPPWGEGGKGKYAGSPIVILGGSSAVGSNAIQLAKLSGFSPIITTASLKNKALLESFGATHVVDRNLSAAALRDEVFKITGGPVEVVFDAISLPETQNAGFDLLTSSGTLVLVLPPTLDEEKTKNAGDRKVASVVSLVNLPQNEEFAKAAFSKLSGLIEAGHVKPLRFEVLPGGLAGIPSGLAKLKNDQVSATKLVVHPQETA
ncbi:GroES-like protein [Trametes coccinea BRFM310]|uniref:GroES-like protein n=1 Tax=Trametes coccinea (strain BRFM310) TaxID=1353009 RepID=A0A1Y2I9B1_TRAC3|nr:GroES-like protein [Trametes coccinea BRFM310]